MFAKPAAFAAPTSAFGQPNTGNDTSATPPASQTPPSVFAQPPISAFGQNPEQKPAQSVFSQPSFPTFGQKAQVPGPAQNAFNPPSVFAQPAQQQQEQQQQQPAQSVFAQARSTPASFPTPHTSFPPQKQLAPNPAFQGPTQATAASSPLSVFAKPFVPAFAQQSQRLGNEEAAQQPAKKPIQSVFGTPQFPQGTAQKVSEPVQGVSSQPVKSVFGEAKAATNVFDRSSQPIKSVFAQVPSAFGLPSTSNATATSDNTETKPASIFAQPSSSQPKSVFGQPSSTSNLLPTSVFGQPSPSPSPAPVTPQPSHDILTPPPATEEPPKKAETKKAPQTTSTKLSREERFLSKNELQDEYDALKDQRQKDREAYERAGKIQKEGERVNLDEAIAFEGECEDKCPYFEAVERELRNDVDPQEQGPDGKIDPARAIKKYGRSSAGKEAPLPSDVRTPAALVKTTDYIIEEILMKKPLADTHTFVWNRTRAIRNDFTLQNYRGPEAVETHERIARIHLLSYHHLVGTAGYEAQQELEQLEKTLLSLEEFYNESPGVYPNEAEFRAYRILLCYDGEGYSYENLEINPDIFFTEEIQTAIKLDKQAQNGQYSTAIISAVDGNLPFLMACAFESRFPLLRKLALKDMNKYFPKKYLNAKFEILAEDLRLNNPEEARTLVEYFGLECEETFWVTKGQFKSDASPLRTAANEAIRRKQGSRTLAEVINQRERFEASTALSASTTPPGSPRIAPVIPATLVPEVVPAAEEPIQAPPAPVETVAGWDDIPSIAGPAIFAPPAINIPRDVPSADPAEATAVDDLTPSGVSEAPLVPPREPSPAADAVIPAAEPSPPPAPATPGSPSSPGPTTTGISGTAPSEAVNFDWELDNLPAAFLKHYEECAATAIVRARPGPETNWADLIDDIYRRANFYEYGVSAPVIRLLAGQTVQQYKQDMEERAIKKVALRTMKRVLNYRRHVMRNRMKAQLAAERRAALAAASPPSSPDATPSVVSSVSPRKRAREEDGEEQSPSSKRSKSVATSDVESEVSSGLQSLPVLPVQQAPVASSTSSLASRKRRREEESDMEALRQARERFCTLPGEGAPYKRRIHSRLLQASIRDAEQEREARHGRVPPPLSSPPISPSTPVAVALSADFEHSKASRYFQDILEDMERSKGAH